MRKIELSPFRIIERNFLKSNTITLDEFPTCIKIDCSRILRHRIDFGKEEEVNTRVLIYELLDFIDDVVDPLGSRHAVSYVNKMLEHGTGADRQLKVFEQSENLVTVVDYIHDQFLAGL